MPRHKISEDNHRNLENILRTPQWRTLFYSLFTAGARCLITGCLAQAGDQSFRDRLRRTAVHAPRDMLLMGPTAMVDARSQRSPDRALLCCDLVYTRLFDLSCSPRHSFFMDLSGFWVIHYRLGRYSFHGSVDDLASNVLARRVHKTNNRSGFGSDRCSAPDPRSQGPHADSSRETL